MTSLRKRSGELEIMDDLDCKGEVVDQTLRELEVINRLLGGDDVTIDGIASLIKDTAENSEGKAEVGGRAIEVADFGCGGGDLAMKMVEWGRRRGLNLKVEGIDANAHIIEFAKQNCKSFEEISFARMDVFDNRTTYDIITATLFVHHFGDDQLVELFRLMRFHSRIGVVINDIHRHWLSYHSIRLLTGFFSKSAMVQFDAPLSVRRAFRKEELVAILERAGITNYSLRWRWAFRWQLVIRS